MMEETVISKRCAVKYTLTWWKDPLSMQVSSGLQYFTMALLKYSKGIIMWKGGFILSELVFFCVKLYCVKEKS